ncbi:hypothetical protein GR160_02905 [Flavobacterium sp. Sd200]|uniref:hypothetical protein n=1 Tax=Flavobacterium sp. Sd200 TaxID=2692211 RepID=UPI00136D9E04|nr:hypothetical protein [Flavobacterium sp. Sd200]MXN90163.1 hypothetical protein [Flavobacterium sp. Sd200]
MNNGVVYRPQPKGVTVYNQPQGLNGFWRSLFNAIVGEVGGLLENTSRSLPIVGGTLGDWINRLTRYAQQEIGYREVPIEATPEEEIKISAWKNKYKLWLSRLAHELEAAAALSTPVDRLNAINVVVNKLNTVADHFANYETDGFTENGIIQRDNIIYETMQPMRETIKELVTAIGATTIVVTFNPQIYLPFVPLITTTPLTSVQGDNYVIASTSNGSNPGGSTSTGSGTTAGGSTSTGSGTTAGGTKPATGGTVVGGTVVGGSTTPVVTTTTKPTTPVVTVPTTPAKTSTEAEPENKSSVGKIIALLGLAGVAYYALATPSKPVRKKATGRKTSKK